MAVPRRITRFLRFHDIDYEAIEHDEDIPTEKEFQSLSPQRQNIARVMVVRTEDAYYMIVLPTGKAVPVDHVREALQLPHCRLATEDEIAGIFSDCEAGALPALGNLYNVPVVLDESFGREETICFSGGTRHDAVLMRYCDFAELTHASVVSL